MIVRDMNRNLDDLRVASPCPADWEQMKGDDRVRFCDLCQLHVYNFAQLSRKEANALVAGIEGRLCARLYRRTDGTVITRDCPVGLRAVRRQAARVAGAVFATLLSLAANVLGQKQPAKDKDSCKQQVAVTRKAASSADEIGRLSGTIVDPMGALVPNAKITITDPNSKRSIESRTDEQGSFQVSHLAPGTYDIEVQSPGFKTLGVKKILVGAKDTDEVSLILMVTSGEQLIGVIGYSDPIDTPAGTTIIPGNIIRRLPLR